MTLQRIVAVEAAALPALVVGWAVAAACSHAGPLALLRAFSAVQVAGSFAVVVAADTWAACVDSPLHDFAVVVVVVVAAFAGP